MKQFRAAIERAYETGDADGVVALLDDDIVFRSPVVHAPYEGRRNVEPLIRAVARVFDEFGFVREIRAGAQEGDHALVFRARIGDREIEGCDFLHVNRNGLIDEFYVMVRPLSGALALAEVMGTELAAASKNAA
jgi:ketosteroid isomerase-like protein